MPLIKFVEGWYKVGLVNDDEKEKIINNEISPHIVNIGFNENEYKAYQLDETRIYDC